MSPGGELPTMFTLYHTIRNSRVPIHTINMGACHSAAFIVFLAGHKRTMLPDAQFIAHEGSGVVGGTFRETKAAMARYERDVARMAEIIASNTTMTVDEIKEKYNTESDWYIDDTMAKSLGVITE
jgi:ATP-dependent Clp protease protease subunit